VNNTLQELHCDNNGITLAGLTDLINALHRNTSLLYLPPMQESRQMALKQMEDQVKQLRNEAGPPTRARANSVRSKLASKVVGKAPREKMQSTFLSDQDIKAALGLIDENWERQEYRLQQYLQRNFNIANGIPTPLDVDDEEFERPDTAESLSKIVEQVKFESTPTVERDVQLGSHMSMPQHTSNSSLDVPYAENQRTWKRATLSPNG
jgi:hypothetical protein